MPQCRNYPAIQIFCEINFAILSWSFRCCHFWMLNSQKIAFKTQIYKSYIKTGFIFQFFRQINHKKRFLTYLILFVQTILKKVEKFNFTNISVKSNQWKLSFHILENIKFTLIEKIFRQINSLVISLVKTLISRKICQKSVRVNFHNFHAHTAHCNLRIFPWKYFWRKEENSIFPWNHEKKENWFHVKSEW